MTKRIIKLIVAVALATTVLTGCDILIFILGDGLDLDSRSDLTVSVEWNYQVDDVDLYVSFPEPFGGSPDVFYTDIPAEYLKIENTYDIGVTGEYTGFFPDHSSSREIVSASNRESAYFGGTRAAVELIDDVTQGGGPETVTVRRIPFGTDFDPDFSNEFATDPSSANGLDYGATYAWVGVMEVYLEAPYENLVTQNGGGADARVTFAIDGDTVAIFDAPEYVDAEALSIARVNLFLQRDNSTGDVYNFYQILPDIRLYGSASDFRGEAAAINLRGAAID